MRINCHSHIFNLRSVFTKETISILLRRLPREGWDPWLVDAAAGLIKKAIGDNAYVDEEKMMQEFVSGLGKSKKFKQLLKDAGDVIPMEVGLIGSGDASSLGLAALKTVFGKLSEFLARRKAMDDAHRADLWDLLDFLRIGLMPDISDVADRIMGQLSGDDGIIVLMMDITPGDGSDNELFEAQTAGTSETVLDYPGRIFPFYAVNPARDNYYQLMHDALDKRGFVGVKLYPSLGYKLNQIEDVFQYCVTTDTPIMVHCSQGGFYARKTAIDNSHPKHWRKILEKDAFANLKICFGHFGGDENIVKKTVPPQSWTQQIIDLMTAQHPGVYADISYHTDAMEGAASEANYFKNIDNWLKKDISGKRILFGTDYFLVRRRLREENHWAYFEAKLAETSLGNQAFKRVAQDNPSDFLGLPKNSDDPGKANIQRYADFIVQNRSHLKRDAAPWLQAAVKAKIGHPIELKGSLVTPGWSRNNQAHVATYKFFRFGRDGEDGFMYRSHYDLRFAGSSGLKLRQMQYWNKEHEDAQIFNRKCAAMARRFDKFLTSNGVAYEGSFSSKQVVKVLTGVFKEGGTTFAEMAAECDRLYRFSNE
ncbi:MAG: amidohydrolase family protein [Desulfobacteraceae bacterium]|jgi:predicted TIM-barrel fold metal-dependent hydrolase